MYLDGVPLKRGKAGSSTCRTIVTMHPVQQYELTVRSSPPFAARA
jgi:hypothetical protein